MPETPPRENLVRAMSPELSDLRMSADGPPTLTGHFARYNEWNVIDSVVEGRFLERVAPGAYAKSLARGLPKVQFNHGKDPEIGDKLIAIPRSVEDDDTGPHYAGDVLDGLPPLLLSGLRAGLYGSSYRFSVVAEDVVRNPTRSAHNPDGITERTITEADVYEFGPVTWPADAGAGAAFVRSLTDEDRQVRPAPPVAAPVPPVAVIPPRKDTPVDQYVTRDEKAARVVELKAVRSRMATEYPGVLPPEQDNQWNADADELRALEADITAYDKRIADVERDAANIPTDRGSETTRSAPTIVRTRPIEDIHDLGKLRDETRTRSEFDTKVRENALRSIDAARLPKTANVDALRDIIERADEGNGDGEQATGEIARRVLLTGAPAYRRAFTKYLRGEKDLWSPEETRAAALAVVGTTTTGGYAVPYIFDPTMTHIGVYTAENPFRQACRVETITNGNNWRTVTVGAVTSAYVAEPTAATEQGPTFGQPTYTVQRAHAFATLSIETLEDRPDITAELTSVFAESKATLEENKFAVGAGTTVYPMGMFTDTAYTNVDTATDNVTAIADLRALEDALPLRFRKNAAFFMNRSTLRQFLALDTSYRYFTGAGIQFPGNPQPTQNGSNGGGNTGLSCLGYPIWEVPSAVSTLTTDSAIIVVFADPKSYIIVDRIGMNVELVPLMLNGATPSFPTGERGIYAYWRNTAKPIVADAGRSLSVQ